MKKYEMDILTKLFKELKDGKPGIDFVPTKSYIEGKEEFRNTTVVVSDNNKIVKPFTKQIVSVLDKYEMIEDLHFINKDEYMSVSSYVSKYHVRQISIKDLINTIEFGGVDEERKSSVINHFSDLKNVQIQQNTVNSTQTMKVLEGDEEVKGLIEEIFKYSKEVIFKSIDDKNEFMELVKSLNFEKKTKENKVILTSIKDILTSAFVNVASSGLLALLSNI